MKARLRWTTIKYADNAEKPTVKTSKDVPCCKSLESLPVFTKKEIDEHRIKSGKRKVDDTSKSIKENTKAWFEISRRTVSLIRHSEPKRS